MATRAKNAVVEPEATALATVGLDQTLGLSVGGREDDVIGLTIVTTAPVQFLPEVGQTFTVEYRVDAVLRSEGGA